MADAVLDYEGAGASPQGRIGDQWIGHHGTAGDTGMSTKIMVFPRPEVAFKPGTDGTEEMTHVSLVNPSHLDVTFKFLTNADSRGLTMHVSPPKGVIPAEGSLDILFLLKGAPLTRNLDDLRVVLETWFEDARHPGVKSMPSKMRLSCLRSQASLDARTRSNKYKEIPGSQKANKRSGHRTNKKVGINDLNRSYIQYPSESVSTRPFHVTGPYPMDENARYSCDRSYPNCDTRTDSSGGRQGQMLFYHASNKELANTGKPTFFIDTIPFAGKLCSSELAHQRFQLIPYLVSLLVWGGLGIFIGRGYLCDC